MLFSLKTTSRTDMTEKMLHLQACITKQLYTKKMKSATPKQQKDNNKYTCTRGNELSSKNFERGQISSH